MASSLIRRTIRQGLQFGEEALSTFEVALAFRVVHEGLRSAGQAATRLNLTPEEIVDANIILGHLALGTYSTTDLKDWLLAGETGFITVGMIEGLLQLPA